MSTNIPVSSTWLGRFEELIEAAFYERFDREWKTEINPAGGKVCAVRPRDMARVCVDLHPGMSVVIPHYAVQRVCRELREAATRVGYLESARN